MSTKDDGPEGEGPTVPDDESIDPTGPGERTEDPEPAAATAPTRPEPSDSADPADDADRADHADRPDHADQADGAEPADGVEPADSAQSGGEQSEPPSPEPTWLEPTPPEPTRPRRTQPGRPQPASRRPGPKRPGRPTRPGRKRPRRLVRFGRRVGFVLLGLLGLGIAGFVVVYLITPVPSARSGAKAEGSVFYYADGKTAFAKQGPNRVLIPLDQVPPHVRAAVISAENRTFYTDPGVSVSGTVRALWSTVSGEQLQGGSTITQQMVRNYYNGITQERTVVRKLKEVMVALKVGRERNKDWILEQYLNTIYFGRDAYGIQAAAHAYYNTDVSRLTPAQGAYLAAAIQMPSYFADPFDERQALAEQRWRYVIDGMVRLGAVRASDAATMTFPRPGRQKQTDVLKGQVGYMVNIAKRELGERGYTEDEINRGGFKIVTTFHKPLMDAAQEAVTSNLPTHMSTKVLTGLVSVDPRTGEVVAFYGGRDYLQRQLSTSFGSTAQAGSGFKPYVLAAALAAGKDLSTTVNGSSPQTFNGTDIHNNEDHSYGMVNLVTATQQSINTAYVNLGQDVGLDKVSAMAEKLGIPKEQLTANGANTAPTFPLGTVSVSPVQQAGGFAAFAAEGVYHKPHVIKSVARPDEEPVKITEKGRRVFSRQVAADATYAMTQVVERGTGTAARLPDRKAAGKTGTTDEGRAIWFNGFVPQLATSVGIFRTDNKPLSIPGYSIFGGVLPAQIWHSYMAEATQDMSAEEFGAPSTFVPGGGDGRSPTATPTTTNGPRPTRPPRPGPTLTTEPEPSPPDPGPSLPTIGPSDPRRP